MTRITDLPSSYEYDKNGFIRQVSHIKFPYSIEYKARQGTNVEMSYLRLGWISSFFSYEEMKKMNVVDVGCGNGIFVKCCSGKFGRIVGYDIVGESITEKELKNTTWDLIILSDVLEHFENVEDLFSIKWKHCMLSFPELPEVYDFSELEKWRHYKPNEHLYYLTRNGVKEWLISHNAEVIGEGNFEDLIRTRWNYEKTNVSSIMAKKKI